MGCTCKHFDTQVSESWKVWGILGKNELCTYHLKYVTFYMDNLLMSYPPSLLGFARFPGSHVMMISDDDFIVWIWSVMMQFHEYIMLYSKWIYEVLDWGSFNAWV